MRILHIAPFNTAGVPYLFMQAERTLGNESHLITLHKHSFDFNEDISLNLRFISTPGLRTLKKALNLTSHTSKNTGNPSPPIRKYSALEKRLFHLRDKIWSKKIDAFLHEFDITSFDLYQLDGGKGLYYDSRVIKHLHQMGKPIVCTYYGSDLRTRGVIPEIDKMSSCNFTVEYDHLDRYPGIHHIPLPFDFSNFLFRADVQKPPVVIGHAPSNRSKKGTNRILKTLKILQKSFPFEIMLIENQPYQAALNLKSRCTLFIDQISELGYGINAVESMAMGIPTFSSLMNHFKKKHPTSPIIEVTFDNLEERLLPYLESPERRLQRGKTSREWVTKFHDSLAVAKRMQRIIADNIPELRKKILSNV